MRRPWLLNYALYQVGWLACIIGAAQTHPHVGAAIAAALIAAHLWFAEARAVEARLALSALAVGLAVELFHVWSGTYARFASGVVAAWISPPWLLMMWAQFATTFRYSLRNIMAHPGRAAAFGVIGGPIAFLAGERLGAVALGQPLTLSLLRLSVTWGLALWILGRMTSDLMHHGSSAQYRLRPFHPRPRS
jgi:hypothetical protein